MQLDIQKKKQLFAELIIFVVTFLWATTFIGVKLALRELTPNLLVAYRFTIALILLIIWKPKFLNSVNWRDIKWGLFLGFLLFVAYISQTVGMQYTQANKSAFITSMSVVLVPFFSLIIEKKMPRTASFIGVILAIIGLYFLLMLREGDLNKGDFYTVICSVSWGLYIVILSYSSKRIDFYKLLLGQFFVMTIFCWLTVLIMREPIGLPNRSVLLIVLYMGIFCSFLTTFLQTKFQKFTTSTKAALIFTMEPILAALFAFFILNEILLLPQIIGAIIIVCGIIVSEIF